MRSSTVTTVLQATAIYTASILLTHHASKTLFSDVLTNPGVAKFAATVMNDTSLMNNANDTLRKETPSNSEVAVEADGKKSDDGSEGPWLQITIPNGTELDWSVPDTKPQEPFYTKELPIDVFAHLVMCTLQYYWLLWLAHILPARSRRRSVIVKEKGEMSEDREEEVIKKWIAQGRVHRASLNWCNTFFKWVLNLTVGRVWWFAALHVVRRSLRLQSPKKTWEDMLQVVAVNYAGSFIQITPLAELIAFITMPAYKQGVFVAGADFVFQIFFVTVVRLFAGWAVNTEFAQELLGNWTETWVKFRAESEMNADLKQEL